jgi:aminoglycoside phosphotransferase (APT) family kinase protein
MATMADDERAAAVRRAVDDAMPALGRIARLRRVEIGWGNENWTADTEHGRVMVKIGLADSSAAKWRSAGVALRLARAAGVPTPELLAFEDASAALGGRILRIFSYLDGRAPQSVLDDTATRARFLGQLGETVARLHEIALPKFSSRIGAGDGFVRWSQYLANRWSSVLERAHRAGLDTHLVSAADAALFPLADRFDDVARPVLCHRDLYYDNLLCDRAGNLVGLLDFDMAEAWEPAGDFHKLRWWVFGADADAERAFLSEYRAGGALPDDFDVRVRVVEIIELVNGLANWIATGDAAVTVAAAGRLRDILGV